MKRKQETTNDLINQKKVKYRDGLVTFTTGMAFTEDKQVEHLLKSKYYYMGSPDLSFRKPMLSMVYEFTDGTQCTSFCIMKDDMYLCCGTYFGYIQIISLASGEKIKTIKTLHKTMIIKIMVTTHYIIAVSTDLITVHYRYGGWKLASKTVYKGGNREYHNFLPKVTSDERFLIYPQHYNVWSLFVYDLRKLQLLQTYFGADPRFGVSPAFSFGTDMCFQRWFSLFPDEIIPFDHTGNVMRFQCKSLNEKYYVFYKVDDEELDSRLLLFRTDKESGFSKQTRLLGKIRGTKIISNNGELFISVEKDDEYQINFTDLITGKDHIFVRDHKIYDLTLNHRENKLYFYSTVNMVDTIYSIN